MNARTRGVTPRLMYSSERDERPIGALLVESGKMTAHDTEEVVRFQLDQGLRFGEAAMRLRLVTRADVDQALARQFDYSYLVPGQSAISPEVIAAYDPFAREVEE